MVLCACKCGVHMRVCDKQGVQGYCLVCLPAMNGLSCWIISIFYMRAVSPIQLAMAFSDQAKSVPVGLCQRTLGSLQLSIDAFQFICCVRCSAPGSRSRHGCEICVTLVYSCLPAQGAELAAQSIHLFSIPPPCFLDLLEQRFGSAAHDRGLTRSCGGARRNSYGSLPPCPIHLHRQRRWRHAMFAQQQWQDV
jgi:hypothetical protein